MSTIIIPGSIGRLDPAESVNPATDRIPIYQDGLAKYATPNLLSPVSISFSGLDATVGAFSFIDGRGQIVNIPQQQVTLIANSSTYLVLDLFSLTYYQLGLAIHSGGIPLYYIVTNSTGVTSAKQVWNGQVPKTAIPNFLNKLYDSKAANNIRIAKFGTSLEQGAGGTPYWWQLLFDDAYASEGFNIPNLTNVTLVNHAVGSATSSLGLAMIAEGITNLGGAYDNTAMAYAASYSNSIQSPPDKQCGKSPAIKQPYDLAIIGFGANGGDYDLAWLENIIINLRKVGTEVILLTQNFAATSPNFLLDHFPFWERMCQSHGCALADTWHYMLAFQNDGDDVLEDNIHPSTIGQVAYASAISGVINPEMKLEPIPAKLPADRVVKQQLQSNDADVWGVLPNYAQIAFKPFSTTGTLNSTTTVENVDENPALLFGGQTVSTAVCKLEVGETAYFAHPWAFGVDFLVDGSTAFSADIKTNNGADTLGSINTSVTVVGRCFCVEGVNGASYATVTQTGRTNRGIQVTCTAGTMKILGAVFHVDRTKELNIKNLLDVGVSGTWAEEEWLNGIPFSYYTDTVNDYINFDFEGSDCVVQLSNGDAGGIIHVYLDGQKIINALDLYGTGTNEIYSLYIPGNGNYSDTPYQSRIKAKHSVQIQLAAVGGSAQAPSAGNRRLGVIGIQAFDRS